MSNQSAGLNSFIEILEHIADTKYVLGDRLVEVGISGPTLEATLSAVAIAQAELGHARLLYNWSFDLKELEGKKIEVKEQTGKAFKEVETIYNWITLISALYAVNVAQEIILKGFLKARHQEVVTRIQKLLNEQREHILYSRGWSIKLFNEEGIIPKRFNEALDAIVPEIEAWLTAIENDQAMINEGYFIPNSNATSSFRDTISILREKGNLADVS
jgi:ring-1,2-phenylacetyl-CoA epoxidase subunit PaaC